MGKRKHPKLRACGRWGVWLCTLLLIVMIPVSIWMRPGARLMYSTQVHADRGVNLDLSSCRLKALYSSGRVVHSYDPPPVVGFDFEYWRRWPTPEKRGTARWISPVWWVSGRTIRGPEVSLIYPTVIGVVWSLLILHRRRRHPDGHCIVCGYSHAGLPSDVCPECGIGVEGEADG
jgi:hypothetical protein